jgi:outer membrane autotransporter protein
MPGSFGAGKAAAHVIGPGKRWVLLLLLVAFAGVAGHAPTARGQSIAAGAASWTARGCDGCHGATPGNGNNRAQLNAAATASVINHALANIGAMAGLLNPVTDATEIQSLALYIDSVVSPARAGRSTSVAYGASVNVDITDLAVNISPQLGETFTSIATARANGAASPAAVTNGTVTFSAIAGAGNTDNGNSFQNVRASYAHTATNCTNGSFTVTLTNGTETTAGRSYTVTINDPGAPTINTYTAATIAYNAGAFTTLTAPTIGGPAPRTLAISSAPASGTAQVSGANLQYRAAATYTNQVTFQYTATGPCSATYPGTATSAAQTVTVNITAPTPTTLNPTTSAPFNAGGAGATTLAVPTLIGAVNGVVTGVSITSGPAAGTAVVAGTNINFTPAAGSLAQQMIGYTTTGPGGATFSGTITVNITPPGAPTITPASPSFAVPYNAGGAAATAINLATVITGALQSPNPINVTAVPADGTGITAGLSASTTLNYTPAVGNLTNRSFTFEAIAPGGASTTATATITITPPGPPTVTQPINVSVPFNAGGAAPTAINLAPFLSGTLQANPITITAAPALGTGITAGALVGTSVSYTPAVASLAAQTFQFTASAPGGATSAVATVNITVTPPAAPTVAAKAATTPINTAVAIDLTASITGVFSTIAVASAPANGATQVAGNVITYTPASNFAGTDTFTYTATGVGGTSTPATVTVTVVRPTAGPVQMTVPLNSATTLDLAPFITGAGITGIAIGTAPRYGTAITNGTRVTYTPRTDSFETDTFTYIGFGTGGSSAPGTVTVTVVGRPDPTQNQNVMGIVNSQADTAARFSRSQLRNFQQRMEALHVGPPPSTPAPKPAGRFDGNPGSSGQVGAGTPVTGVVAQPNTFATHSFASALTTPQAPVYGGNPAPNPTAPIATTADSASAPTPLGGTAGGASGLLSLIPVAGQAITAAGNGKSFTLPVNFATSTTAATDATGGLGLWVGGSVTFGKREGGSPTGDSRFTTDGISVGVDRRFNERFAGGVGFGYARDKTDIGTDGSKSRSEGYSISMYGSYHPAPKFFVDALLGVGWLKYDTDRVVSSISAVATANRTGNQVFGSISGGYEHREGNVLVSPYGRIDATSNRLNQATETGAGNNNLVYFDERTNTFQAALGLRAESIHRTAYGFALPRIRIEGQHSFEGDRRATIAYADLINTRYGVTSAGNNRNALVLGIGNDLVLNDGLTIGLDWQMLRSVGSESSQGLRFRISKELDGKGAAGRLDALAGGPGKPIDVRVDAGYTFEDNVSRSKDAVDKLSDHAYHVNVSMSELLEFTPNVRGILNGFVGGEKFRYYEGLNRAYGGANAELQYRATGDFDSPILAIFTRASAEHFDSVIRRGYRFSVGASAFQPLTDRISMFGALSRNVRVANSETFSGKEYAARLNFDYAVAPRDTLYATGEYRWGDAVSSGQISLENVDIAKTVIRDDAFTSPAFFAYRFDAKSILTTFGYNFSLGSRDSIDLSWRRVQTTPDRKPVFRADRFRYITNQYSIVYLVRF